MKSINFKCTHNKTSWTGKINALKNYGSHYEMKIESRSGITVVFGKTSLGNFACIPDFKAGCHLAELNNEFYNSEKLISTMKTVDAITVAKSLKIVTKKIGGDHNGLY